MLTDAASGGGGQIYAAVLSGARVLRMLTYAHVCSRKLTYADVC
jgi:hypothetical protein